MAIIKGLDGLLEEVNVVIDNCHYCEKPLNECDCMTCADCLRRFPKCECGV